MTGREWKPGEMARTKVGNLVARTARHRWVLLDDGQDVILDHEPRRLVVIDPEDRAGVAAFCDALTGRRRMSVAERLDILGRIARSTEDMQAALREFANPTPPKPPEPTGLGAVVRLSDGTRWIRYSLTGGWWFNADSPATGLRWADLDVVEVLTEGVAA